MQLAPSKNPQKESKQFSIIALVCGIGSLFLWFLGIAGLALGVRAAILSHRVKNMRYLAISVIAIAVSLVSLVYYYTQS